MTPKVKQISKIVLVVLFIAALLGLTYWMIALRHDPWWLAVAVDAGILAVVIAVFAVRRYLMRRREKRFIDRLVQQDEARIAAAGTGRHQILELQEHWKTSVNHLRRSFLRKKGNPLYVLPWYMIIGESGAGKTSAIKRAGLNTPLTDVASTPGVGATRNCDWWFFDKAIILDTAGRYTIPVDEGGDLDEWKAFLALLARYRKREPLNGVIVAVAADRLLEDDMASIEEKGRSIRQRIDQMMRIMGAKFPVYVLVTKMDRIFGFTGLNHMLEDSELDQAMGYMNTGKKPFWKDVFQDAVSSLEDRLHRIRFQLLHRSGSASDLMQFPSEFHVLTGRLGRFLESVFKENTYQETPHLQGVFFSSALRKGVPVSEFLEVAKLGKEESIAGTLPDRGIYLKDFFARILPSNRNIFTPLAEYALWKKITSNLALSSWLLFGVLVSGILCYTWLFNRSLLDDVRDSFFDPPSLSSDVQTDLILLEKFREEIINVEIKNHSWILPVMGFEQRTRIEEKLKEHYCSLFESGFIKDIDKQLLGVLDDTSLKLNRRSKAALFGYLVLRINALNDVLHHTDPKNVAAFAPLGAEVLKIQYPDIQEDVALIFGSLYYSYLDWDKDVPAERQQLFVLQQALARHLKKDGKDGLEWLAFLQVLQADDVHMDEFWSFGSNPGDDRQVLLTGAYTDDGRKKIKAFLTLLDQALQVRGKNDSLSSAALGDVQSMTDDFWRWYDQEFYHEWYHAVQEMNSGTALLDSRSAWQQQAVTMVTEDNPYFMVLDRVADELGKYEGMETLPSWAQHLVFVSRIKKLGTEMARSKKASLAGTAAKSELKIEQLDVKSAGKQQAKAYADSLAQADAWNNYVKALSEIPIASMSRKQMTDNYADCFDYEKGSAAGQAQQSQSKSPFVELRKSYSALQSKLKLAGGTNQLPVLDLIAGPLGYLLLYAGDETSCYLQQQWTESVLSGLDEHDSLKTAHILFDSKQGTVWKYVNGPALPFLANSPNGYGTRKDFLGNKLPFLQEFFGFLNQGALVASDMQTNYAVQLTTLPVGVNAGAKERPEIVRLGVNCIDKPFELENYNYTSKATIQWSPGSCGDTQLEIVFPEYVLTKKYPGAMGFAHFLNDFRDGTHVFGSGDFPEQKVFMQNSGVTAITVSYTIQGSESVTQLLNAVPETVPQKIINCWDPN